MISRRKFLGESATLGAAVLAERLAAFPENRAEVSESNSAIAPSGSPNVLIFMPDQQNGSTVLADSPVVKPNLDRFRTEAVTFTSAHCPAPHCCPSRASFMSGLYPSEHGVFNNVTTDTAIHPNPYPGTPFWGLPLKAAGYDMAYSGKLHVGRDVTPETCGFRNICSLEQDSLRQNEAAKLRQWQVARTEVQTPSSRKPGQILRPGWPSLQLYQTLPEDAYKDLADYRIMQTGIVELKRMAVSGQPWCLMISNSGSHDSYNAPRQFVDLYDPDKIELPVSFRDTLDDKPRVYQRQRYQYWSQLSDQETRDALRHYYAKCSMQDALFGELLQALDATGQRENTLVIYVSDHGDYHAAH